MNFWNFLTLCGIWFACFTFGDSGVLAVIATLFFLSWINDSKEDDTCDHCGDCHEDHEFNIDSENSTFGSTFPTNEQELEDGHIHFLETVDGVKVFRWNWTDDSWEQISDVART